MKKWTGIEITEAHQGLEHAAALNLGRMLFEFSRLDFSLGLMLAWTGEGKQLQKRTKELEEFTFHKKLDLLDQLARIRYKHDPKVQMLYTQWLADAHFTRQLRNQLVHGRWGIEPTEDRVVNVTGLPTSPHQLATPYTIAELAHAVNQMALLQRRLAELRSAWPV